MSSHYHYAYKYSPTLLRLADPSRSASRNNMQLAVTRGQQDLNLELVSLVLCKGGIGGLSFLLPEWLILS